MAVAPRATNAKAGPDEAIEGVGGINDAEGRGCARGGQDGRRRGDRAAFGFAPTDLFAGAEQGDGKDEAGEDTRGRTEEALFDGIAGEQQAAEREGDAAEIDDPARADRFFE